MLRKVNYGGVILILSLLTLVGCQSEKLVDDSSSQGGQVITLTASRGLGSRTEMGDIDPTTKKRLTQWSSDLDEKNHLVRKFTSVAMTVVLQVC